MGEGKEGCPPFPFDVKKLEGKSIQIGKKNEDTKELIKRERIVYFVR